MKLKRFAALLLAGGLCTTAFTGCALNKNETVATLGDQEIKLGVANFMCRYQQARLEDAYKSYFGDEVWSKDLYGDGSTLEDTTKSQLMKSLQEMYTLQLHMDDYGVTISDDEKQSITDAATAFIDANSKDALEEMGATQDIVEEVLTLYTIKDKMYDAIVADVDTDISDDEANMRAYSMLKISTDGTYDSSYQYTEYTDDQKAELTQKAQDVAAAIEQPSDLEAAAEQYGFSVSTGTYDSDDSNLDSDVKAAMDGLSEGQISDLITTDKALYIVRIDSDHDEEATQKNRVDILKDRKDTLYNDTLSKWEEDAEWKVKDKVVAKIKFTNSLTQQTESTETEEPSQGDTAGTEAATENGASETIDGTESAN